MNAEERARKCKKELHSIPYGLVWQDQQDRELEILQRHFEEALLSHIRIVPVCTDDGWLCRLISEYGECTSQTFTIGPLLEDEDSAQWMCDQLWKALRGGASPTNKEQPTLTPSCDKMLGPQGKKGLSHILHAKGVDDDNDEDVTNN